MAIYDITFTATIAIEAKNEEDACNSIEDDLDILYLESLKEINFDTYKETD